MEQFTQDSARSEVVVETFIGIDLANKISKFCVLDAGGAVIFNGSTPTTREDFEKRFKRFVPARIAVEAGSNSRVAEEVLTSMGHEVVVANPRRVKLISQNHKKCDEVDAELLARLVRTDPSLLAPVYHRSARAHEGLSIIRARDLCVRVRTKQICMVRGMAKGFELKLPSCSVETFAAQAKSAIRGTAFAKAMEPMLTAIEAMDMAIDDYDRLIKDFAVREVPIARKLQEIPNVGPITAVAFALAVDDPHRFPNVRTIGSYFGLVPRRDQTGTLDKKLPITKAGDELIRRLLTQCGQRMLQENAKDCDLKRFGQRLQNTGNTNKKRAVTALARKLAVYMLGVMKTGVSYDPQFQMKQEAKKAQA